MDTTPEDMGGNTKIAYKNRNFGKGKI